MATGAVKQVKFGFWVAAGFAFFGIVMIIILAFVGKAAARG